jgi:class 3 adenylate cyclase
MGTKLPATHRGLGAAIQRRGGVSLSVTLAVSISALVLIAVLAVMGIGLWSAAQNTMSLLRDKTELMVSSTVDQVRDHLDPARAQVGFVEQLIARGALDPSDRERFVATMTGALAAAPQINAILHIDPSLRVVGVARLPEGPAVFTEDYSGDERVRTRMTAARSRDTAEWGEPLWRDTPKETMLNIQIPLRRGERFMGLLVAAVGTRQLSRYLAGLDPAVGSNVFVLYDREHVLAHPNLQSGAPGLSGDKPLPNLSEVGDPVLSGIWRKDNRYPLRIVKGADLKGHVLDLFNERYIFLYRDLAGYGGKTWQVGSYFRATDVNTEMLRLRWAALAGLFLLGLAILAAVLLGRRIAKPVIELSAAASHIGKLEISETAELPGSVFRELNDQARAFNAMLRGLRWFEIYLPKKLVGKLIGDDASLPDSVEREVTVMFTDVAGFTGFSEGLPADTIAAFLNRHFAILGACIEEEDGTVDKFIGDSVMAFWGAPDRQSDHAARAARAAREIIAAIEAENAVRATKGEPPVRVRIGLHSGSVTVGNIGSPGRINYTIIGDTVNIAQRLEQLGKEIETSEPEAVTVLLSAATAAQLGPDFSYDTIGGHQLRGRDAAIDVFRLRQESSTTKSNASPAGV